jgi:hypothetical protein
MELSCFASLMGSHKALRDFPGKPNSQPNASLKVLSHQKLLTKLSQKN